MMKDAMRGETHYVGARQPFALVLLANGAGDALLLDAEVERALVLAKGGQPCRWSIDETARPPAVRWDADFRLTGSAELELRDEQGALVGTVAVDPDRFAAAMDEALGDTLLGDATFRQLFLGEGCEPITETLAVELVAAGHTHEQVEQARSAGAMYCRPRDTFLHSGFTSDDEAQ